MVATQRARHHGGVRRRRTAVFVAATLLLTAPAVPSFAAEGDDPAEPLIAENDAQAFLVETPPGLAYSTISGSAGTSGAAAPSSALADPLGLVPMAAFQRRYTMDADTLEVWRCGPVAMSHASIIASLEANVSPYYAAVSDGVYTVDYFAGGDVPGPAASCVDQVEDASTSNPEGVIIVDAWTSGGYASPGYICSTGDCGWIPSTYPGNGRYVVVGDGVLDSVPFVAVHEVGHSINWPHSNAGVGNEYDNPIDVMSANQGSSDPYHTLAYNRYQAGWLDPADVVVYDGTPVAVDLDPQHGSGTQMVVIHTGTPGLFYTLDARVRMPGDPIPSSWDGVEVHLVDQATCPGWFGAPPCPSIWRDHLMEPPTPYTVDHVLDVGDTISLQDVPVAVTGRSGDTFTVTLGLLDGGFGDTIGHIFESDIAWLADAGITKGCNPPANTMFCPDDRVTRGQMAAFLVRAMGYADDGGGDLFADDDTSVFESDIDKLATAGVTSGCNPPTNTDYCPDSYVTRGQLAAFLHRALA